MMADIVVYERWRDGGEPFYLVPRSARGARALAALVRREAPLGPEEHVVYRHVDAARVKGDLRAAVKQAGEECTVMFAGIGSGLDGVNMNVR